MFLRPLKSMYAARPRVEARGFQAEVWRRNWCLWLRTGCAKTRGGLRDGGNFRVSIPNGCLSVSAVESAPFARLSCTLSSVSPAPQHTASTWSWSTDSGNAQIDVHTGAHVCQRLSHTLRHEATPTALYFQGSSVTWA